jgi:phosphatidate cytidylyltransferase
MNLPWLFGLTAAALVTATVAGQVLRRTARSESTRATIANMNDRIAAWWALCGLTGLALVRGETAVLIFFALFSGLALREFVRLTPLGRGDRSLLPALILFTALQYWAVWRRREGLPGSLIPAGAALYIPAHLAIAGDTARFLERTAKAYWGLMVCTFCLSYAPALLTLEIRGYAGRNTTLLFYFLLVAQSSDVLQYCWGKLAGRRPIAPRVSPNKTWEGFLGGVLSATALGTALHGATPFEPWQAAVVCGAVTLTGFAGGLIFSAIKRGCGVKDFGSLVVGLGGVLDRIDSLCFSAPVFFHLTRYFCPPGL